MEPSLNDHPAKLYFNSLLVGIEIGETDPVTLSFLDYFNKLVPIDKINFLNIVQPINFFDPLFEDEHIELLLLDAMEDARRNLDETINQYFRKTENQQVFMETKVGDPLEELLKSANELDADLIIIGQKSGHGKHNILARRFARKASCNALLIPENAPPKISKILVPFDFSELSVKALKMAISLKGSAGISEPITCLCLYDIPPVNWGRIQRTEAQIQKMMEADRKQAFESVLDQNGLDQALLAFELIENKGGTIGKHIADYAHDHGFDLIVMGAKGHSMLNAVLLGSVTEKVVELSTNTPVLIIR